MDPDTRVDRPHCDETLEPGVGVIKIRGTLGQSLFVTLDGYRPVGMALEDTCFVGSLKSALIEDLRYRSCALSTTKQDGEVSEVCTVCGRCRQA